MSQPHVLKNSPLFMGIDENDLQSLLVCLKAVSRTYRKDECVFMAGSKATAMGLVVSGGVRVLQDDFWGHRAILAHVGPGELFGEAFSCVEADVLPVSVLTSETSEIMLLEYRKVATTCSSACVFHARLVMNMVRILAKKNILLTRKIEYLSQRTMRDRLLSFLSAQAVMAKSTSLELPFNRQELADYLCVERSSLSRELGAMQADGLIRYTRNRFELVQEKTARQASRR